MNASVKVTASTAGALCGAGDSRQHRAPGLVDRLAEDLSTPLRRDPVDLTFTSGAGI